MTESLIETRPPTAIEARAAFRYQKRQLNYYRGKMSEAPPERKRTYSKKIEKIQSSLRIIDLYLISINGHE